MNVLLAGGSGLVGKRLTKLLRKKGHEVAWLSRQKRPAHDVRTFVWDVPGKRIEPGAIAFADAVINLAGAGVADRRWTESYKKEIYSSRIGSTSLLAAAIAADGKRVNVLVNASAIGIYGHHWEGTVTEETEPGNDFLARVCRDWERAALPAGIRTCFIRTGIVLSENEGLVGKLKTPVRFFAGAAIGSGMQITSWIHLDDLCLAYLHMLENETLSGAYNAVAPVPVTNAELTRLVAERLNRRILLPNIPDVVLNVLFGEMAGIMTGNQPVSAKKLIDSGYTFRFSQAEEALRNLLG